MLQYRLSEYYEGDLKEERIDTTNFKFPSDKLTFGVLRKLHPELFDTVARDYQPKFLHELGNHRIDATIGNMMWLERLFAFAGYAEVKNLEVDSFEDFTPEEFEQELKGLYIKYGLARGEKHAAELVKDIERQGREAANAIGR